MRFIPSAADKCQACSWSVKDLCVQKILPRSVTDAIGIGTKLWIDYLNLLQVESPTTAGRCLGRRSDVMPGNTFLSISCRPQIKFG